MGATGPSTTVCIPLAAPLPIVLERLRKITTPPHWPERLVTPHIVCEIGPQELYLRRSHTLKSLGTVGFRATLDLQARQLTGTFQRTTAATLFLASWSILWSTVLVLTIARHARPTAAPPNVSFGTAVVFCLACLAVVPLLGRVPRSDRHPQRRWLMAVLQSAAGGPPP